MSKRNWIIIGITVLAIIVIIGLMTTIKLLPFWAAILAVVSYIGSLAIILGLGFYSRLLKNPRK